MKYQKFKWKLCRNILLVKKIPKFRIFGSVVNLILKGRKFRNYKFLVQ